MKKKNEPVELPDGLKHLLAVNTPESLVGIKRNPNPKCKKCYGRGVIGINMNTGDKIICSCVLD